MVIKWQIITFHIGLLTKKEKSLKFTIKDGNVFMT